jgi:ADP-heptose:LPS heptosyltransferase/predicted SAM-dependent methyltransferase
MNESSKLKRKLTNLQVKEWFSGQGIDIGCGKDIIYPSCIGFDKKDGDANNITKYVDRQFDFVYSSHTLEHMIDPFHALSEWWKLVKPSGTMIVTVPDEDLYEQGVFPSKWNVDHKWTFTIHKEKSWSNRSVNITNLISSLPNCEVLCIEQQSDGYVKNVQYRGIDQTKGAALAQIMFVLRKLPESTPVASKPKRNILFKTHNHPGDVLIMTAAVRDLAKAFGDRFNINVQTTAMDIWNNNPYLNRSITERNADMIIKGRYVGDEKNASRGHCIQGWIKSFEAELGVSIPLTKLACDIHLTEEEKNLPPMVEGDYWIINAGYMDDTPTKDWGYDNYQKLVDSLKGKIKFVQIGRLGPKDKHNALNGVIDLRGKTTIREWILLTYHSRGVVGPVSACMHMATMETKDGRPRPCVVISGARETPRLSMYENHTFLNRVGWLDCCRETACMKRYVVPEMQGSCTNLVRGIEKNRPMCMEIISVEEVAEAIIGRERWG